jgi:hypothetical protein
LILSRIHEDITNLSHFNIDKIDDLDKIQTLKSYFLNNETILTKCVPTKFNTTLEH